MTEPTSPTQNLHSTDHTYCKARKTLEITSLLILEPGQTSPDFPILAASSTAMSTIGRHHIIKRTNQNNRPLRRKQQLTVLSKSKLSDRMYLKPLSREAFEMLQRANCMNNRDRDLIHRFVTGCTVVPVTSADKRKVLKIGDSQETTKQGLTIRIELFMELDYNTSKWKTLEKFSLIDWLR